MQLPRKAVLIRICIYGPILAYFGYLAWQKYSAEQAEADVPGLEGSRHTFTLPDGKSVEVVEITEEQARQMGLEPPGAADAKSPAPAPPGAN